MNKTSILIVEDEAIIAADLAGKLGRLGYEVAGIAAKGQEAVALASRLDPQLVLMDISLPGSMDGIEAAEVIHREYDVPVIYLTAHSDPDTLARAKLTGPFGYILKPFDERELATQIELGLYKHQADRQLREQREWLRVTLTSIGDAVIATDASGRISFVNPVAESLIGWKAEEAMGRPVDSVFRTVSEQTGETLEEPVARALREGRTVTRSNHTALVTRDGHTVPVEDSAAPILDVSGQVIGAALVFHDVTEKRRAEEALRKAHDELDLKVKERTAKLTETNKELKREIKERTEAEQNLKSAINEIKELKNRLEAEKTYLQEEIKSECNFENIIGNSVEFKYTLYKVEQIAPSDTTVVILGETGTGKELIARAIHGSSSRKNQSMVKVNCAALPSNLMESELFGHEKGAFTGAYARRIGRFEVADGATLFLDEIGELPLELQAKLLRVLQDGEFERVGSSHTLKIDVRIIAATNRDLNEEVRKGRFRKDLWYRLNIFPITVPPLRNRLEDIPLLVEFFVGKISKRLGKSVDYIPKSLMDVLQNYHWPGNIRELENVIERAVINSSDNKLRLMDKLDNPNKHLTKIPKTLDQVEYDHIVGILQETRWKVAGKNGAAKILGLNPSTLRARMRKFGIRKP